MNRLLSFLIIMLVGAGAGVSAAQAQVLVYKVQIEDGKGINYHAHEGGYFVAPLLGGTGSFLLTSSENGRSYVEAPDSGRLFTAVRGDARKAVVSAETGTGGSASGAMLAFGDMDHRIHITSPTADLSASVAQTLRGTVLSSDDESDLGEPTSNGSLGVAGISDLKLSLDENETRRANDDGLSLAETMERLKLTLERQGYGNADEDDDDDPGQQESDDAEVSRDENED